MQPDLFADVPRPKKAGRVTATSVLAYQSRPRDARVTTALGAIDRIDQHFDAPATSAELALFYHQRQSLDFAWDRQAPLGTLLEIRRGLSDALALGLVEHAGQRVCAVSGKKCLTWKVRTR